MRFLCGNLDLKIIIFDYKQRLLVARLRYLKVNCHLVFCQVGVIMSMYDPFNENMFP